MGGMCRRRRPIPPLFGVSEGEKIRPFGKLYPDLQSVGGKAAAAATTTAAGFHCGCRAGVKRHLNGNIVIPVIASGVPGRGFSPNNIFDFHRGGQKGQRGRGLLARMVGERKEQKALAERRKREVNQKPRRDI